MKVLGVFLLVIGFVAAIGSLAMTTTASVDVPASSIYDLPTNRDVYNLGLLQHQMMVFVAGCAIFVLGGALVAIGEVNERLSPRLTTSEAATPPAPSVPAPSTTEDTQQSLDEVTGSVNGDVSWIIGVAAVAVLLLFFFVLAGALTGNSSTPATNITDLNVTDTISADNMMAQAQALTDNAAAEAEAAALNAAAPRPKATPEPSPISSAADDDAEIGRDNWEGE